MSNTPLSGLLVVDKPRGPTSHDVVGRMRRILGTRSVGHAGTLDPMATGVLVVMVGACTKLSRFLTLEDKKYRATVRLGESTDTLDAEGTITETAPIPPPIRASLATVEGGDIDVVAPSLLADVLAIERGRTSQVPPSHSAIKQNGVASYKKARRGEVVALPPRDIRVLDLAVVGATLEPAELHVMLHVSKGYYVRSFARDVGQGLGVPSHLSSLRRVQSGPWGLDGAVTMESEADEVRSAIISLEDVARTCLPTCELTADGARRALYGQRLADEDFSEAPGEAPTAWFDPDGRLIAVGDRSRGWPTVLRAFLHAG